MTIAQAKQRISKKSYKELKDSEIFSEKSEKIVISFLLEEYSYCAEKRETRAKAGKMGGIATAKLRQSHSNATILLQHLEEEEDIKIKSKSNTPDSSKSVFSFSDDDLRLSEIWKASVKERSPNFEFKNDVVNRWANQIRLMREKDGKKHAYIQRIMKAVHEDDNFWGGNIFTVEKLRLRLKEGKLDKLLKDSKSTMEVMEGWLDD